MSDLPFFPVPVKATIKFKDLDKIDVRIGTILEVQELAGSHDLVKLQVDLGNHRRQIIVRLKPEETNYQGLVGKQSLFVINLKPRKILGELSEGVLFDIGYLDRIPQVLAVPESRVPNGSRLG